MFFILSKVLDFLLQPLVWALIFMILGFLISKKRKTFLLTSMIILYFFSNEFIFMEVSRLYEYPIVKEADLKPSYSTAIVLGGMVYFNNKNEMVEFQGSADRILNVLPLYFDGRVKKILIAGGSGRLLQNEKEAPVLKDYLISIGVKRKDILIESDSKNTYENAKFSKELIKKLKLKPPFLLSTSASHMRRSIACFEKQELKVDPFPVDYYSREREFNPDRMLRPKAHVLGKWDWMIHEWMGFAFYKIAAYI